MRGFLGFVLVLLVCLSVAAFLIVPLVVRPIVVDTVRAASPFGDQALEVEVDVNTISLLLGRIDRIHVTGNDLEAEGAEIGRIDVSIDDVSAADHTYRAVSGQLGGVALPFVDGSTLVIDTIELAGASGDVSAIARLDVRAGLALVGSAFADAGIAVEGIELIDGGVALLLFGQRVQIPLGVDAGALVLVDVAGAGPLAVVEPGPDDPWRITGVTVTPSGVVVDASLDPDRLVGEG